MTTRLVAALLLGPYVGCAAVERVGPEQIAASYLGALGRGDPATARGLSIEAVRTSSTPLALPPASSEGARWRLVLRDGRELWLVEEQPGQWRVDDRARLAFDSREPLGAARTFLAAALGGDLGLVRRFLPEAERARLVDDGQLRAHLDGLRGRLEQARAGVEAGGVAAIDGERAQIPYAAHRVLRLVREQGQWRVLDLE